MYKSKSSVNPEVTVGTRVRCLRPVVFVNSNKHNKGDEFIVETSTLEYFRLFTDNRNYAVMT